MNDKFEFSTALIGVAIIFVMIASTGMGVFLLVLITKVLTKVFGIEW